MASWPVTSARVTAERHRGHERGTGHNRRAGGGGGRCRGPASGAGSSAAGTSTTGPCSVYSTSVLTVFLGPYLTVGRQGRRGRRRLSCTRWASRCAPAPSSRTRSPLSVLLAVLVMPLAGAVADRTGPQEAAAGPPRTWARPRRRGCSSWTATAICWAGRCWSWRTRRIAVSMVLYNSFLPQIADARGARRGLLARLGLRLRGGRAGAGRATWCCSRRHDAFGVSEGDGGADLPGLGGAVVGRLHPGAAAAAARPRGRARRRGGGVRSLVSGWRQLRGDRARHAPAPADAGLPAGVPGLQRRHPDGDLAGLGVRLGGAGPRTSRR